MRHRQKGKRLDRPMAHRKAVMRNLAKQLLENGRIVTTLTKAKLLRGVVEPLITRAKSGTVNDRREVFRLIDNKATIAKLFNEVAPLYKERNGGYTRVIKYKNRAGDNAPTAIIELIDYEKVYVKKEEPAKGTDKKEKAEKAPAKEKKPKAEKKEEPKEKAKEKKEKKEAKK